jgi:hypothetical protein
MFYSETVPRRLAFDGAQRDDLQVMLQPGQLVRVNLAGLHSHFC